MHFFENRRKLFWTGRSKEETSNFGNASCQFFSRFFMGKVTRLKVNDKFVSLGRKRVDFKSSTRSSLSMINVAKRHLGEYFDKYKQVRY